jgi:diguanylate cyclase (GGDEF)-like protein/PAS domain S-box-containing protein
MFGWTRDEALSRTVAETIIPPQYREAHAQGLRRFLATRAPRVLGKRLELSALDRAGREFPIEITFWSLGEGNSVSFYAFAQDITERKKRERELEQRVYYDALTGLPNRKLLLDRLEQLLARREHPQRGPAVLFLDLDRFKCINDSLGHAAGDQVLMTIAKKLRQAARPMDTVARLAGDEFVVVCPDMETHRDAALIAKRMLATLANPIRIEDDSVFLTASVGIALADETSAGESLIGAADAAMYQAKGSGRGQYELFDERMRLAVTSRLHVESELNEALEREQLRLHFQPIMTAADGRIAAVEALLRWAHPERGLISPDEFMPIAEDTGLIVPIGAWVLEEACRCARAWKAEWGLEAPLCVSINLSARQLAQSDLVPMIERILTAAAIDPMRVQFGIEVTETVMMRDPVVAAKKLQDLKALGIHLAIDDFGTGYSSLAYLRHFPVDTLKIDRSFVSDLADDPADLAIVHAITNLARSLELSVVAEGVETEAQARALRGVGVTMMQGFLFAHPQPPEELVFVHEHIPPLKNRCAVNLGRARSA